MKISTQTWNVVDDANPDDGYKLLKEAGFQVVDFSLHTYLKNTDIYKQELNSFFNKTTEELKQYFLPQKIAAEKNNIEFHQMHMPYPLYVPTSSRETNDYMVNVVASKSLEICSFLNCSYIVIHGFKLNRFVGSEVAEWQETEAFIHKIAPVAKEMGITICIENLYDSIGKHLIEGPCCNARLSAERIDRINDKYGVEVLGYCLDTGHANLIGIDFQSFIETLGSRLKVLHIHDNDGAMDLHQIPYTFTKTRENKASTDWDGFIEGLRNIGYAGTINFETAPVLKAFPNELKFEALKMIAAIGRYFEGRIKE